MRSIWRIAFAIFVALLTTTAIATPALAAPEWYAKKAGVYEKITKPVSFTAESKNEVTETKNGIAGKHLTISCKGTTSGVVGAGGAGKISEVKVETFGCTCAAYCEKLERYELAHFLWGTELYKEGTEIRDRIQSGGNGNPLWRFE